MEEPKLPKRYLRHPWKRILQGASYFRRTILVASCGRSAGPMAEISTLQEQSPKPFFDKQYGFPNKFEGFLLSSHYESDRNFSLDHPNHSCFLRVLCQMFTIRFEELMQTNDSAASIVLKHSTHGISTYGGFDENSFPANMTARSTQLIQRQDVLPVHHDKIVEALRSYILQNNLFYRVGRVEDMVLDFYRINIHAYSPDHPNHSYILRELCRMYLTRFQQQKRGEDLDTLVVYGQKSLYLHSPNKPARRASLNNLAISLFMRFEQRGRVEDLDACIACYYQAANGHPRGDSDYADYISNLSTAMHTRFKTFGRAEDLEAAIRYRREVVEDIPRHHPHRSTALDRLAATLHSRFKLSGKNGDLVELIAYLREILDLRPLGHPERCNALHNLAMNLFTRFDMSQVKKMEDLEEAISYSKQGLQICFPNDLVHFSALSNFLASAVYVRYTRFRKTEDLEEAIGYHRRALDFRPPGHSGRPDSLNKLGIALLSRFDELGKMEDLEETVYCHRQALECMSHNDVARASCVCNLATALKSRFVHLGRIEDLHEAITFHRHILGIRPIGHPDRPSSLHNLACSLFTRSQQHREIEDLDEAVMCSREAVIQSNDFDRTIYLSGLAGILASRYLRRGWIGDIDEAIAYYRETLQLRPLGHSDLCYPLIGLAKALSLKFEKSQHVENIDEAFKCLSDAESVLAIDHPWRIHIWTGLAEVYVFCHRSHSQPDDCLQTAMNLFAKAVNYLSAGLKERLRVTLLWIQVAKLVQDGSGVSAYAKALLLLDQCLVSIPTVESQQAFLASAAIAPRSIASDAAAVAVDAGQLETAVEFLEQGRTILWSRLQGHRQPFDQLLDVGSELANRFNMLNDQLERLVMSSNSPDRMISSDDIDSPITFDKKMRHHRLLTEERKDVLQKIRMLDGFQNFMQASPFDELRKAAADGPVILVNISEFGSDAIILHTNESLVLVPLPEASPSHLRDLSSSLLNDRETNTPKKITQILRSLWEVIVAPVTEKLVALGVVEQSRIWWCPTSASCGLPLHAAGPYASGQKNLPDIYISSYTPTLSTLIRSRAGLAPRTGIPSLLAMGQPGDNSYGGLPEVREELRRIHSFGDFVDVIAANKANRDIVLSRLKHHPWVHFACHGHQQEQPFHSYFQLHDGERLTILDLIEAGLPNAEFAFLSACHSAAGSERTPDEVIHFAAAVQFSGFRSVVGTLWAMADIDGPDTAEDFYKYMFRNPGGVADFKDAAVALNRATREMRKRRVPIDRWINFIHIGA